MYGGGLPVEKGEGVGFCGEGHKGQKHFTVGEEGSQRV